MAKGYTHVITIVSSCDIIGIVYAIGEYNSYCTSIIGVFIHCNSYKISTKMLNLHICGSKFLYYSHRDSNSSFWENIILEL